MRAEEILERLEGAKPTGPNTWAACCPAHDDRNPSLSITLGDDERVLLHCHAGCSTDDVVQALGLKTGDLFAGRTNSNGKQIAAEYDYTDKAAALLYQVVRFAPKDFRQRRPDGHGGWEWKLGDTPRVLYRLPAVVKTAQAGGSLAVVEGEKDVHALEALGKVATCNPGGAGKWRPEFSESLRGAKVAVIADRDEPGRKHAAEVAQALDGIAAAVKVLEPAEGKDVSDHLAACKPLSELIEVGAGVAESPQPAPKDVADVPIGRRVELTPATDIRSERVCWLDTHRMPLRGMIVLAGEKGLGKSIFTNAHLPALLTRGELEGELKGKPSDVLVASAEDDWAAVVKPRLMAHGADLSRVHRVRALDGDGQAILTLPDDVALLEEQLDKVVNADRRVAMLVIDPIGAFLTGSTDSHKDADVRRALAPLAAMAERRDLAVVVVAHLTKDDSRRLISRVSGSGAFVNAARSVLGFARNPDDPEGERGNQRVLIHVASNWGCYAPSLGFEVKSRTVEVDDGSMASVGHLVATGEVELGAEDLQRGSDESGAGVGEEIAVALKDGPRASREVKAQVAAELGCSRKTVERHAKRLESEGRLEVTDAGSFPRTTTWGVVDHSRDTPVGTSLGANGVPTGENGSLEPKTGDKVDHSGDPPVPTVNNRSTEPKKQPNGSSRDSGDSLPAREATEAEVAKAEAEERRIAAKFGEQA